MSRRAPQTPPVGSGRRSDRRYRRPTPGRKVHLEVLEDRQLLTVAANPDAYVALRSVPLSIPAPGVLGNDSTNSGTALAITGYTQPADGTLALNPDGSFRYAPTANYTGPDAFTYTVADGRGGTATATVRLQVNPSTDEASVFAGPRLADVDSTQGTLLNAVLGGLVGTNLNLSAADYDALANGSVDGGRLADALGAALNVSPAQALTTDATLGQVFSAAATAAQADGNTAEATALGNLAATVAPLAGTVQLGNLLQVSPNAGSLAGASLNGLDLATGSAQLFNFDNVATTPTPITVSGASLGLPGVVGSVAISSQVIEPPVLAIGPAGTQFHTSAVRTRLDLNLADNLDTSTLTNRLQAVLGSALVPTATATLGQLSVYAEVGEGQGMISAVDALANAVTLQATPGVANVYLGNIADDLFFNRTHAINPSTDVQYGTVGTLNLAVANNAPAGGVSSSAVVANDTAAIQLRSVVLGDAPTATSETFVAPFPQSQTVDSDATFLTNLARTLAANTTVQVTGVASPLLQPLVGTVIQPAVSGLVTNAVAPVLQPALTNVAQPALRALGVDLGQLDLTVQAVAQAAPPAANPDSASTPEGVPVAIPVLANDATAPGSPVTVIGVTQPAHGTATINPDGTVTYTPAPGYYGPDNFTYTIADTGGDTSTGAVTVGVTPTPPAGRPDSYTTTTGQALVVPASTGILSNDTDPNGLPLQAIIGTMPAHGTLALNPDGSFGYDPTPGFAGTDTFTYSPIDANGAGSPVTVTLNVQAAATAPNALPDAYTVASGSTLLVPTSTGILANDTDPGRAPLAAVDVTLPSHGTLALNPDGSFGYTPAAGFVGTDSFVYRAYDGTSLSNPTLVTLAVTPAGTNTGGNGNGTGTGGGTGTGTGTNTGGTGNGTGGGAGMTTGPVVTPVPITGTAGTPTTGPVATFTDPLGGTTPGSYTATIDYGDGSAPVAGTVTGGDGTFTVVGTHTYPTTGTYPVTVTVARAGASASGATRANIGPAAALLPSVSGTIFLDTNRNGRDDPNEYGVANITVTLTGTTASGLPVTRTATTDAQGNYTFGNLDPGTYAVRAGIPAADFNGGRALVGTAGGVARGEAVSGIAVGADTAATGYNFAALVRPGCRLNTASVRAALRVGPDGTIPIAARGVTVSAVGPMTRYFPTLAARLRGPSAPKGHPVAHAKVHAVAHAKAHPAPHTHPAGPAAHVKVAARKGS